MTARRSAIVAGGGIGGLAAAIGLRRAGWTVTVLEQADELREVGAGWSFAPNAVRAADALGVGDEFRAVSVPTEAGATLRVPSGRYLMRFAAGRDTPLLANHRADLQRVLLDHLPAEWVHTGAEVIGVEQSDTGVTVTYRTRAGSRQAAGLSQATDGSRHAEADGSGQSAGDMTLQAATNASPQTAADVSRQIVGGMAQQDAANASRQAAADLTRRTVCGMSELDAADASRQAADVLRQVEADVLVGADGIHSVVRRAVWPDSPAPVFQRILCWRGVTEPGSVWPVGGFQTWGRGARFGAHPLSGQRVFWFLTVRAQEPGMRFDDDLAEVRRRIGGWHEPIPALLSATPPDSVLCHDIADLDPLGSYVDRRVALLGDAAHAMTPFLAQGACQALEDAAVLAAELAGDVPTALARYDQARRPRSQRVRRMARQDPAISLSTSPVVYGLMTGLTRLAGGGVAARKAAQLWDWTPPTLA